MSRIRTFVALPASREVRAAAETLVSVFSKVAEGVRWVQPENIHLTLKFLGDVEDQELHQVCRLVKSATETTRPFGFVCRAVGAFPSNQKPSTLWLGVDDAAGELAHLQSCLSLNLSEMNFPSEARPFRGHFTLGRIRSGRRGHRALTELIEKYADTEFGLVQVNELVVYASELTRAGPTYTALARCPLGAS